MLGTEEQIQINGDPSSGVIELNYTPKTTRTLFDICDLNGRILKTGKITHENTAIELSDLSEESHFIILVLDGDRVCSRKLQL